MTRQFAMLTFLFAAAAGTIWSWQIPIEDHAFLDEPDKIGRIVVETNDAFGRKLDDRIRRRRAFAADVQVWVRKIGEGKIDLVGAADGVIAYCTDHYPEYLEQVNFVEPEPTVRLKVIRNLLRHFEAEDEQGMLTAEQNARLPNMREQYLKARGD